MRATIFFLTFVVFIATVVWRVDQVMFGDKLAWGEAQSRAQMSALSHALEIEIRSLKDMLLMSYSEVELGKKDFSSHRPYSQFQMMSKLLPPNQKEDRKDWQVVSTFFQENSPTKKWAAPYITLALKSVKEEDVKSSSANVYTLMDPSRKPYLLLLARGGANWYAGLLGSEVFQGLMDRQKGQKSTVFAVNLQGQALGHTTQEYVGSLLTEDPLVSELIKSSVGSGFGIFKDLKGESVQGLYEQVEGTNIYSVITTPVSSLTENRDKVRWQFILMGLGLAMIGLGVFVYLDRGGPKDPGLRPLPAYVAPAAPVPASISSGNIPASGDRMKAYTQVASSLSHELKSPLSSILGHAQLALNHVEDESARDHLDKIETEARSARELVQKLLIFAGEDKVTSQKMGLETVLNKALKHVEGKILSKGIKLQRNIQSVPQFTMAGDLLVKALENVLLNAIEAMERAPKKELAVHLQAQGPEIELTISDTGEGISPTDLPKIFDPFFTTRNGAQHVGLGLSTALGIFKEAFGEVHVDSEKGKGTSVKIVFNPQENLMETAAKTETPKAMPKAPSVPAAPVNPVTPPSAPGLPSAVTAKAPAPLSEDDLILLDPLLVDNTIEKLIEDDVPDMPPSPEELELEPAPAPAPREKTSAPSQAASEPEPARPVPSFSSKIDKPKIEIKKKTSRLDEMQVAVRRPGERS